MRKGRIIALAAALAAWTGAEAVELTARWSTNQVVTGESFTLELTTDDQSVPQLLEAPEFLTFVGRNVSTRQINRQAETSASYEFTANQSGELTIPPLPVQVGTETQYTPQWTLKVGAPENLTLPTADGGERNAVGDLIFGRAQLPEARQTYYVGEEIPLTLELYIADAANAGPTAYPKIDAGKALFRQFDNPDNPEFTIPRQRPAQVNDRPFTCLVFRCAFRALAPGKLTPTAAIPVRIVTGNRRRPVEYEVPFTIDPVTIKPLPPLPADMAYTGLIGNWQIEAEVSGSPRRAGEALTLQVRLRGDGAATAETLLKPVLDWPGCRVYPAETELDPARHTATLRYTFVPLEAGELRLPVRFAVFDPATGSYRAAGLEQPLEIAAGQTPVSTPPVVTAPPTAAAPPPGVPAGNLHYLKLEPQVAHRFGIVFWTAVLFLAGPLFGAALWFRRALAARVTPGRERRNAALRRKKELLRRLEQADQATFPETVQTGVLPYLTDLCDLPPGLSAGEVADRIADPELARLLRDYAAFAYAPTGSVDWRKTAEPLRRVLKHFLLVLLVGCGVAAAAATPEWETAFTAYDRGDFAAAERDFASRWTPDSQDAALWYNLGCCAAQLNHWARAAWYFEGAELLEPGDSAVRENLNTARRKLLLEEYAPLGSPGNFVLYLRDLLRPEEYWLLLAAAWCALWVWWSFRKRWSVNVRWTVTGVLLGIGVLALDGWWSQRATLRSGDRGVVCENRATLYALPSVQGARELGTLRGGTPVKILESRSDFLHVNAAEGSGWVPKAAVGRLP